jgi:hypothetical protein
MNKVLLLALVIVVGMAGVYYVSSQRRVDSFPAVIPVSESPMPSPMVSVEPSAQPSSDLMQLKAGGSSYSDPQGVFGFLYPNDYTIDSQEKGRYVRIFKKGATQKGQTEMYDGVIVSFERVELGGKTLSKWVDDQIQQSTSDGSEITQPKKGTTLNVYPGFTFEVRSLGTSTNVVLQKDLSSPHAVRINFLVADPEGKNYQKEVDAILATVELRK